MNTSYNTNMNTSSELTLKQRRIKFAYRYAAERRTPAEWIERIERLPESHRGIVARVVWWDWFADRTCGKRVYEFDRWLNEHLCHPDAEPEPEDLMRSMVSLGYPMEIAQRRFKRKFTKPLKSFAIPNIKRQANPVNPVNLDCHDSKDAAPTV
jgi:hypothetical protein